MCGRFSGSRGAALTWLSNLTFEWALGSGDSIHKVEVSVKANNASERGVPFPMTLKKMCSDPAPAVNLDAARFDAWASEQTCWTLCPCGYLGALLGDEYEREPSRWK